MTHMKRERLLSVLNTVQELWGEGDKFQQLV